MTYKELVPRKVDNVYDKRLEKAINGGYVNNFVSGYNQSITDHAPLYDYVEKLERALDEIIKSDSHIFDEDPCSQLDYVIDIARKARTEKR